jgi:hypothetical protein
VSISIKRYEDQTVPCSSCGKSESDNTTGPKVDMRISETSDGFEARIGIVVHASCLRRELSDGLAR